MSFGTTAVQPTGTRDHPAAGIGTHVRSAFPQIRSDIRVAGASAVIG
jgi:hypothetical protein